MSASPLAALEPCLNHGTYSLTYFDQLDTKHVFSVSIWAIRNRFEKLNPILVKKQKNKPIL